MVDRLTQQCSLLDKSQSAVVVWKVGATYFSLTFKQHIYIYTQNTVISTYDSTIISYLTVMQQDVQPKSGKLANTGLQELFDFPAVLLLVGKRKPVGTH